MKKSYIKSKKLNFPTGSLSAYELQLKWIERCAITFTNILLDMNDILALSKLPLEVNPNPNRADTQ